MDADRIAAALARIEAAVARIDAAREAAGGADGPAEARGAGGSARVVELVNVHERLREQVAESLRELDDLLAKLED
jgi:predicted 2-oxoglutarate/Fe(II)-dependent dioxygenase YbiX